MAFGKNEVDGCSCPAVAAGEVLRDSSVRRIAWRYDDLLDREVKDDSSMGWFGTVSEEKAKKYWLQAIEDIEEFGDKEAAEAGQKIARELGWVGNE